MTPPTYRPALMIWDTAIRYQADISAGALKVPEQRVIADLLLLGVDEQGWKIALISDVSFRDLR
jgi:hypothetical protein